MATLHAVSSTSSAFSARPSSSPATFSPASALPQLLPLPTLSSLINVSNLEHFLTAVTGRLTHQEALIAQLQAALSAQLSVSAFSSFSSTLMQHIEQQDKRMEDMQRSLDALQPHTATLAQHSAQLQHHSQQLRDKADTAQADDRLAAATDKLQSSIDALRASSAPLAAHQRLDSSVHLMASQMAAVQASIAHKIDRAELPLLEGMAQTVAQYGERLDATEERVDAAERQLDDTARHVQAKADKAEVDGRLRQLGEEVGGKVGAEWLQSNVVDDLRDVQDELLRFAAHDDTMRSIIEQQERLHDTVHSHHTQVSGVSTEFASAQERWLDIEQRFREKVDVSQYQVDRREEAKRVEQLLHATSARTTHDFKVHASYLADLRQQLQGQHQSHVQQSEKLAVALKFIDWFTESKLAME